MYKIYTYICIYIKDLFISPFVLFKRCFTTWRAFISLIKKPTISSTTRANNNPPCPSLSSRDSEIVASVYEAWLTMGRGLTEVLRTDFLEFSKRKKEKKEKKRAKDA